MVHLYYGISWWFPITREAKKQRVVFRSFAKGWTSCEGSHNHRIGLVHCLLLDLGISCHLPMTLKCDNKATLRVVANPCSCADKTHRNRLSLYLKKKSKQFYTCHNVSTTQQLEDVLSLWVEFNFWNSLTSWALQICMLQLEGKY